MRRDSYETIVWVDSKAAALDENTKNSQDSKYLLNSILSLQYIYYLHRATLSLKKTRQLLI